MWQQFQRRRYSDRIRSRPDDDAERNGVLSAYTEGVKVTVNVAVLTEGWDHPPTSAGDPAVQPVIIRR